MRFLKKANNGIQIVQYEIRDYVIIAIFIDFQILQFFAQFQQNSKLFLSDTLQDGPFNILTNIKR